VGYLGYHVDCKPSKRLRMPKKSKKRACKYNLCGVSKEKQETPCRIHFSSVVSHRVIHSFVRKLIHQIRSFFFVRKINRLSCEKASSSVYAELQPRPRSA
jgi:hypothetical protein